MSYQTYLAYIDSAHWKTTKAKAFAKFGRRCQCCGSKKSIEGHHLIYRTPLNAGLVDDVLPICKPCHRILHMTPAIEYGYKCLASVEDRRAFIIAAFLPKIKTERPPHWRYNRNKMQPPRHNRGQTQKERLIRENDELKTRQQILKAKIGPYDYSAER